MDISNQKIKEYTRRIMTARMKILSENGFFGLLLMHLKMNISNAHSTAWTDRSDRIYFCPEFMDQISDSELEYVMKHELMHIVLHHLERWGDFEDNFYNYAADIVVNSNILEAAGGNEDAISIMSFGGPQMHTAPDGSEGCQYTVEELYTILTGLANSMGNDDKKEIFLPLGDGYDGDGSDDSGGDEGDTGEAGNGNSSNGYWDYHPGNAESAGRDEDGGLSDYIWQGRVVEACEAIRIRESIKGTGNIPMFARRFIEELKKPQTDWRAVLNDFVQEEVNDYSFCPPDRRMSDSPFFLPDFNEKEYIIKKILFMIDTSGSMSDDEITQCYSEIKGAIDQFDGRLEGWLGFFDAAVTEPVPFVDEEEFIKIQPVGGGGTNFHIIFDYVSENMSDDLPVSIVILTDGEAHFPPEEMAMDIPVLWVINNDAVTPPWGRTTRIKLIK